MLEQQLFLRYLNINNLINVIKNIKSLGAIIMYKILIVDDEKLLRQGFKNMVDWRKHNFVIVGEASNGEEAIDKINTLSPDIVVTDVKMPIMDGIELTRYIKKHYTDIEVIVLSSFDDFNYVKETMKSGAVEYILKPTMEYGELFQVLEKTCSQIHNKPQTNKNSLKTYSKSVANLQCFIDYYNNNRHRFIYNNFILLLYTPINNIESHVFANVEDNNMFYMPYNFTNVGICLVNFNDSYCGNIYNHIKSMIALVQRDVYFFASDIYYELSLTKEKYELLMQKLDLRFYLKKNTLISESYSLEPLEFFCIDNKALMPFITQRDYVQLKKYIYLEIEKYITRKQYIKESHLKNTLTETYFFIKNSLSEDYDMQEITFKGPEHLQCIHNSEEYSTLMPSYDKILCDIFNHVDTQHFKRYGGTIGDAICYIKNNYDKDITLTSISKLFHLNKSYFCELFKQQTGENFSKYLANLRIKNAKKLLKNSDYSVYEISEIVGYKDSSYFCKVFKSITGMSPLKYVKTQISDK